MRATWRTAFEWARLLYQMNPKLDPYGVLYMIDQLALRARQSELFLRFCEFSSSDKKGKFRFIQGHLLALDPRGLEL